MIVLAGTLRILCEDRDSVLKAFKVLQDAAWANGVGLLAYHFSVDLNDENVVHVYEEWDNTENLKAHGRKKYMDPFRALRTKKKFEVVRFSRWRAEELGQF